MELPARIGKYELQEYLGGGMSRVYRARDTVIGRTVAVKILTEQACQDPEAKARFLQEARVAGNIGHDNIIRVYDFGEVDGRPYMVMEFLRGEDLRSLMKTNRTGDLHCKLAIALQIARALEHIHAQKIIHRDIKPENIQVTTTGVVKLMDFGIAKAENTALTRPGFTLGTPYYMAPEQIRGMPVTPLVDIYAFGIMLFELITGIRPTEAEGIEKIFYLILHQPVDVTPLAAAGAPQPLCDLVATCTAKDPAKRPPSFSAVCAELERILRRLQRGPVGSTQTLQVIVQPTQGVAVAAPAPTPGRITVPAPTPGPTPAQPPRPKALPVLISLAVAGAIMLAAAAWLHFGPPGAQRLPTLLSTPTGEMVLVPEGPFLSGPEKTQLTLPGFYIDKTEVTNAAYARFCTDKSRPLPELFLKDHPYYPVVNITYVDAQEFAKWAGKRLPSLQEWEKAARGGDGRLYPWGNNAEPARANVLDNPDRKSPDLMSVDSFPEGASPYHVLNMVGNVWEFTDELRTPTEATLKMFARLMNPPPTAGEPWYTIRGGAYDAKLSGSVLWEAGSVPARYKAFNIGFRCVKDAK
ncbi:MAG: bifunctional serine/threonine-protein kinase/formylglycine-generating enzyme family protein [Bryobacteraceae bacterium]|jgi:serine/threonine-protein kinase